MSTEKPPTGRAGRAKEGELYSSFVVLEAVRSRSISFAISNDGLLSARLQKAEHAGWGYVPVFSRSSSMRFSNALNPGCSVMGVCYTLKWFLKKIVPVQVLRFLRKEARIQQSEFKIGGTKGSRSLLEFRSDSQKPKCFCCFFSCCTSAYGIPTSAFLA